MNTTITIQGVNLQGQVIRDSFKSDGIKTTMRIKETFTRMYNLANVIIL